MADGIADRDEPLGGDPFGAADLPPAPAAGSGAAAAVPAPPPPVTASDSRRVVLENGLTLIVKSTPDARTFAAHLLFRDRARREKASGVPRGTADVVHRMMALGTADRTEDALRGDLARLGVTLKVTDSDWIPYDDYYFTPEYSYVRVETIDSFALDALALLGEIVLQPRWTPETFAKAKAAAVARARSEESTPRSVASNLFLDALGSGHPEEGGALGSPSELEKLQLADARRHHASMTSPDAMALVISGNLPADVIEAAVRAAFGGAERGAAPHAGGWKPAPAASAREESATGREQSWIVVGAPLPDVPAGDEPALRVAAAVLSERLAEQLREREGLAYSIGADLRLEGDGPYVRLQAGTRPENLERMEAGLREVAAELAARPPGEEELAGARNRGEGRRRMRRLSRMGDAYAMAMAELAHRDPLALDADLPALRAVTPADVARVAAAHFSFDPAVVAIAR
jgi:predicted Zn-dependent peptidase